MTSSTLDIISHSSAQTQRLGARLGELLGGGELILLDGQLGTGKTTFTQGLAQGLGITEVVNSPTFTLLKEYRGQPRRERTQEPALSPSLSHDKSGSYRGNSAKGHVPTQSNGAEHMGLALYHFDLYRLDDPDEIVELGFEDYFYGSGVCVVEWADKAGGIWPTEHLRIRMKMLSETKRGLLFTATSARYSELLRQFQKNSYAMSC